MASIWFKAPSNMDAACKLCGDPILTGELISDYDEEYFHEKCFAWQIEDTAQESEYVN